MEGAINAIPAVANVAQVAIGENHPAEVTQGPALLVHAVAGHAGGVEEGGALGVAAEAEPFPLVMAEGVVHVAEHHQGQGAVLVFLPGWEDISRLHESLRAMRQVCVCVCVGGGGGE